MLLFCSYRVETSSFSPPHPPVVLSTAVKAFVKVKPLVLSADPFVCLPCTPTPGFRKQQQSPLFAPINKTLRESNNFVVVKMRQSYQTVISKAERRIMYQEW